MTDAPGPARGDLFDDVARELAALRPAARSAPPLVGIVIPVFNDWVAFARLVVAIDEVCVGAGLSAEIIVVDDGSLQSGAETLCAVAERTRRVRLHPVRLVTNLGHQRAIAIGLVAAEARAAAYRAVIVMDADGEDRPEDIPRLLAEAAMTPDAVICVRRGRRTEGARFTLGYAGFKALFALSTGKTIDFGHYCVLPPAHLPRLVHSPALWSHFAAALLRSGLPLRRVTLDRGTRYAGRSSMNLTSLIRHGLNAIAVFEDVCLVRLLLGLGAFSGVTLLTLLGVLGVRLGTDLAIPGWATNAAGLLLVVLLQAALLAVTSVTAHLNRRSAPEIVPARDVGRFLVARPPQDGAAQPIGSGEAAWKAAS